MSGYTESSLLTKLAELKISAPSIQGVALWIMHHKKHYKATVKTWYEQLVAAEAEHKLTLMYLANDVVQNARKKQPEMGTEFGSVMKKVFLHLAEVKMEARTVERLARLVHVWRERLIFDKEVLEEISRVWKTKMGSVKPRKRSSDKTEVPPQKKPREHDGGCSGGGGSGESSDLVSGLARIQTLVKVQMEGLSRLQALPDPRGEEDLDEAAKLVAQCTERSKKEVEERKRVETLLAHLVNQQKQQLEQAESRLNGLRSHQVAIQKAKERLSAASKPSSSSKEQAFKSNNNLFEEENIIEDLL